LLTVRARLRGVPLLPHRFLPTLAIGVYNFSRP
jgi:hypothetical protein